LSIIDEWNINELENRFAIIKDRFLEIWEYPNINIEQLITEGEVNIFQADDPTGKNLEYVIFLDEKKNITSVLELYADVVRQLLELQPSTFFTTNLANDIGLTKKEEKEKLRGPLKVNESYYIEGNLSNNNKFKRIKNILSVFNLEDDLIIKYT
jgi:hypothetical protein